MVSAARVFETAELGHSLDRSEYEARVPKLRTDLLEAQDRLKTANCSVILVIAGVDGAGKGDTVNLLHTWLDSRYLVTHAYGPPSDEERERPPFWRFWRDLPPRGRIGIFFSSWYTDPILRRVYRESREAELDQALTRINGFEKALAEDGTLLLKFWFHLSKAAQRQRFETLERDPATSWRVTRQDRKHSRQYERLRRVSERALRETSTGEAPWVVVEGTDPRYRSITTGQHLLDELTDHLQEQSRPPRRARPSRRSGNPVTVLDTLDLTATLDPDRYERALTRLQGRLNRLWRRAKKAGRSAVAVFEGWDAAGKGGAIRRITAALDARDYQVLPVGAPTDEERAHHYLWRFWRALPRAGRVQIFDRSWYGRVLVERVEGLATEAEWRRAYIEINEFEEQLDEHGIVVLKFWLHISPEEQQRRFGERERTSFKQHKISGEDYRNRDRWNDYEAAANEMVGRTSTEFAPWTLVEANDKRYARIKVLRTLCRVLDRALRK